MKRTTQVALLVSACMTAELSAQSADSASRTFLTKRDLGIAAAAAAGTAVLSLFDDDIARASQTRALRRLSAHDSSVYNFATRASKVNETTLTIAGIAMYGIGRLSHSQGLTDIALHATESVVLASLASQVIRGPLGRTRPYVTHDSDQYNFRPFKGFFGKSSFDNRAFPSIHMSSSMAVATALSMESHRRNPGATRFVAPLLFGAALIPGLSRIELDQHWASDIAAGAFMGVFSAYKVVSYSHAHPNNRFDRMLLSATVTPGRHGGIDVAFSPF